MCRILETIIEYVIVRNEVLMLDTSKNLNLTHVLICTSQMKSTFKFIVKFYTQIMLYINVNYIILMQSHYFNLCRRGKNISSLLNNDDNYYILLEYILGFHSNVKIPFPL